MLRELSQLLGELHDGLLATQARSGVQLTNVEMTLPLELRPILRDGGCLLLADLPRSREITDWLASPSKLRVGWSSAAFPARHPGGLQQPNGWTARDPATSRQQQDTP